MKIPVLDQEEVPEKIVWDQLISIVETGNIEKR